LESSSKKSPWKERTLMNTLVRIALRWAKCVLPFALRAAESPFRPGLHERSKCTVFSVDLAEAESHRLKFRNLNLLRGRQDSTYLEDSLRGRQDSTYLEDSRGWKGLPKLCLQTAGSQETAKTFGPALCWNRRCVPRLHPLSPSACSSVRALRAPSLPPPKQPPCRRSFSTTRRRRLSKAWEGRPAQVSQTVLMSYL
jgi:hypothetical protein